MPPRYYQSNPATSYSSILTPGRKGGGTSKSSAGKSKARWSPSGSVVLYSPEQIRTLTPVRANVEKRAERPELKDVFLCHAWDDRKNAAKNLYDLLSYKGVSVWFSEKDVPLGSNLLREIDKGLAKSRIGLVL